jgi:leucyl aminopeptidase (aminopeptidase T)
VAINGMIEHAPFARALAEQAYARGARYVDVWYWDPYAKASHPPHRGAAERGDLHDARPVPHARHDRRLAAAGAERHGHPRPPARLRRRPGHRRAGVHLGELALVDDRSPSQQSGMLFYETLLDERAASHVAWGGEIPEGRQDYDGERVPLMRGERWVAT